MKRIIATKKAIMASALLAAVSVIDVSGSISDNATSETSANAFREPGANAPEVTVLAQEAKVLEVLKDMLKKTPEQRTSERRNNVKQSQLTAIKFSELQTQFIEACKNDDSTQMQNVIDSGRLDPSNLTRSVDPNLETAKIKTTGLIYAISQGAPRCVITLLDNGADEKRADGNENTPQKALEALQDTMKKTEIQSVFNSVLERHSLQQQPQQQLLQPQQQLLQPQPQQQLLQPQPQQQLLQPQQQPYQLGTVAA